MELLRAHLLRIADSSARAYVLDAAHFVVKPSSTARKVKDHVPQRVDASVAALH